MQQGDKTFTIMVNGQEKVVSLDQLKLVHLEDSSIDEDTTPIDDSTWLDSPPPITSPTPAGYKDH